MTSLLYWLPEQHFHFQSLFKVVLLLGFCPLVQNSRLWQTLYMDNDEHCRKWVRNDDMLQGDFYMIKSDTYQGNYREKRKPAECANNFNFGDRYVSLSLVQWVCKDEYRDPFLAIYDTCDGHHTNLLAMYNCSYNKQIQVRSSGSCLMIYHYRGHQKSGYYFVLTASAEEEIVAFPAGGIAAIVIGSIVVLLILLKIVCVFTGWEKAKPPKRNAEDDTKFIFNPDDGFVDLDGIRPERSECLFIDSEPPESFQTLLSENDKDYTDVSESEYRIADADTLHTNHSCAETMNSTNENNFDSFENLKYSWRGPH